MADNVAEAIRSFVMKGLSGPQSTPEEWLTATEETFDVMDCAIKEMRREKHGEVDKQDG